MSAADAVSCSICWRSKAICCCRRPISISLACAASRAMSPGRRPPSARGEGVRASLRARRGGPGPRFALTRCREVCPRALDGLAEDAIALRELHFLPAPQLLAQTLVAARLGRLALQRPALLLDLEDDVVDAGEVLLRGFELELGSAAAALVLRNPGGLFDELPPIGRTGAQIWPILPCSITA